MAEDEKQKIRKHRHPGSGRRHTRPVPRGRQVDPRAQDEVRGLLGDGPRRRDLLIEYLHRLQDHYHCLPASRLAALAHEMRLSLTEVYEVATFYAHFDVVDEQDEPLPEITVRVCDSLTCSLYGGDDLLANLQKAHGANVRIVRAPCMGHCDTAPVAEVGHNFADHATVDAVNDLIRRKDTHAHVPDY
ncbi:MAG: NAD(P)H-dependent oxidoreductase subunit E, partial [Alphaproteobacteria bacterium]